MVCLAGKWAGLDYIWEQEKLNARLHEMLENAAESHTTGARIVGRY